MTTICFLIPYFGKWPSWMPFFLESCRYNENIDWKFYTDCGTPGNLPPNVNITPMTFKSYCELASKRLGFSFAPEKSYKLCDLKPAFGLIHEEEIKEYDFWAFGDIDVIYGNLRAYFTEDRLKRYDLLATHERRVSGHLTLIRNTELMRKAFMSAPRWKERISDINHNAFDEGGFSRLFIRHKNLPFSVRKFLSHFYFWSRRAEFCEAYSTSFTKIPWVDGSYNFPETWYWNKGRLGFNKHFSREMPYLHFAIWKKQWKDKVFDTKISTRDSWKITKDGFFISE